MSRLRVRRRREGHLEAVGVQQKVAVFLESFVALDHLLAVACHTASLDAIVHVELCLLLLRKLHDELVELRAKLLPNVIFDRHLALARDSRFNGATVDIAAIAHVGPVEVFLAASCFAIFVLLAVYVRINHVHVLIRVGLLLVTILFFPLGFLVLFHRDRLIGQDVNVFLLPVVPEMVLCLAIKILL